MGQEHIAIIGAGSWGTAIAIHLANSGFYVYLVARSSQHVADMQQQKENVKYLPRVSLADKIILTTDLKLALENSKVVMVMSPSFAFVECLHKIKPYLTTDSVLAWGCKGMAVDSAGRAQFFHNVVTTDLPNIQNFAVIGGPSFAKEVAQGLPTAIVVAASNKIAGDKLTSLLHQGTMRCYSSIDIVGVELCGLVKNVLAVAAGISDGLGLGANTRSALITRGLTEIQRLGSVLGVYPETLMGLAGVGDVVLSCTSDLSRNRRLGLGLGRGLDLSVILAEIGQVVESVKNIDVLLGLAAKHQVKLPIVEQVGLVVASKISAQQALDNLLARKPAKELS